MHAAGARDVPLNRLAGSPLLLLLDVDGTLAPIAERFDDAVVPAETRRIVAELARRTGVHVALVSGRAAAVARRMVAVDAVWVVGNHGCETLAPDGALTIDPAVAPYEPAIAAAADDLEQLTRSMDGVLVENKRWTVSVHYRIADPAIVPSLTAIVAEVARARGLRVLGGRMLFELRSPVAVDKGTAVLALAERLGALEPGASVFFAGDDLTDEDAFRALRHGVPHAVTVRVAPGDPSETSAEFTVRGTDEMRALLERIAAVRDARG